MTWFDWVLIGWWAIGAVLTIGFIGKPRGPLTPTHAVTQLIVCVVLTLGLLWTRGAIS